MLNKISLPDTPSPESDPHAKSPPPPPPPPSSCRLMYPNGGSPPSPAVESIHRCFSEICTVPDESYSWENPRRFSGYAKRLELVLNQFLRSSPENFSPSVQTALKGIAGDLTKSGETLSVYRNRSKIYVLINSEALRSSLQQRTIAIGGWLALLDSAILDNPDLHKKTIDLSRDMKQAQFSVTENEERVYCTLRKEVDGRQTSKAVQSAIMMDLARALGTDSENLSELQEQIKLLRIDVAGSNSIAERRILISLERIFNSWSVDPTIPAQTFGLDFEEDTQIQPFKNFLCPLTKEVMKDPVVLESSQTYERSAIEYWFERCIEDGRDPTCPVTGQVLKSLEQKPNIGLAGAIEEWINRNVDIQIKSAVECLNVEYPSGGSLLPVEDIERVCDRIYKISEEHPSSRYK
ncbi:U box domain [Macleaya cordata]|uniref:U box domain n=1 Tax=Macleaya cordata TaxID=56857 RepID=A0A200PLM5_MACCD|nr:U box domain [Macleaya cordata]